MLEREKPAYSPKDRDDSEDLPVAKELDFGDVEAGYYASTELVYCGPDAFNQSDDPTEAF